MSPQLYSPKVHTPLEMAKTEKNNVEIIYTDNSDI